MGLRLGWDAGIDFERTRRLIARRMDEARREGKIKRACYYAVLLTQLVNGSRIGEAVEFVRMGVREGVVRVEKHRQPVFRKMRVPKEVPNSLLRLCPAVLEGEKKRVVARLKVFCLRSLGFNTHSLRFAFVTYMARRGVPAQVIAKITKHKRIDYIITYTQERLAEELLARVTG